MVPYSDFFYFYVLSFILAPAIILGLLEKPLKQYGLLATVIVFSLIYTKKQEIYFLAVFFGVQVVLAFTFLAVVRYRRHWLLLWVYVLLSIAPLCVSKFFPLFYHPKHKVVTLGFLGISYLTFKSLEIIISIYDKRIKSLNFFDYIYFLFFFPTVTSGPINRFKGFFEDAGRRMSRKEYVEQLGEGIWKVMLGLAYKFVIAVLVNQIILLKVEASTKFADRLQYMYGYSFYLFFDFAGYSLIAIGIGYILGIKSPENFNMPFLSKDMKDFWNRWHMSLSFWFRDYIFNKFVMLIFKKQLLKNKLTVSSLGYLVTMGTMGVWHGPQLRYIVYGIYHGALLGLTDLAMHSSWYKNYSKKKYFPYFSIAITFHLVCFGFYIFSGHLV
jgi:membrane protein involved in D-alanine export